jgi:hypothetical protein
MVPVAGLDRYRSVERVHHQPGRWPGAEALICCLDRVVGADVDLDVTTSGPGKQCHGQQG